MIPPIPRQPKLFEETPPEEECPICFLRLPMSNDTVYKACCGQTLCIGCVMQFRDDHTNCPFCRADENVSSEVHVQRIKDRMEKNDPKAFHSLAYYHDIGTMGLEQDSRKAHELWEQSLAIEPTRNTHYNLSKSYSVYYNERGVEKDLTKAMFHLETAAILGDDAARCDLGRHEQTMGNWEYAKKHWMLSAAAGCESCMNGRIKAAYLEGAVTEDEYSKTLSEHRQSIKETQSEQRDAVRAARKRQDSLYPNPQSWPGSLDYDIKRY